jgi:N-hydroxyarylamine O-acetyltransferase
VTIDLDAYLARIGYDGPRMPTAAVLRELHRLHPQTIAFENLDPLLRRPVRLDLPSLEAKMVRSGRGGYCFEQNTLFAAALRALGFGVREATGRVRYGVADGVTLPRTHAVLLVEAEGDTWAADVGFGGNVLTAPLLLNSREPQQTPHEAARLREETGRLVVEVLISGTWTALFAFDFSETVPADYELANWFTAGHPNSRFVNGLTAARSAAGARYALNDNALSIHRTGGVSEKRVLGSAVEIRDALTDLFLLRLDGLDLNPVLARLAARAA